MRHTSKWCRYCRRMVYAVGKTESTGSFLIHLLMTFVTVGLWLPIWIVSSLAYVGNYRCTRCGSKV